MARLLVAPVLQVPMCVLLDKSIIGDLSFKRLTATCHFQRDIEIGMLIQLIKSTYDLNVL